MISLHEIGMRLCLNAHKVLAVLTESHATTMQAALRAAGAAATSSWGKAALLDVAQQGLTSATARYATLKVGGDSVKLMYISFCTSVSVHQFLRHIVLDKWLYAASSVVRLPLAVTPLRLVARPAVLPARQPLVCFLLGQLQFPGCQH